ncbi:MAG: monovalent cation/H+ antiporter complex subunit F [Phycisphaerales bacterium]
MTPGLFMTVASTIPLEPMADAPRASETLSTETLTLFLTAGVALGMALLCALVRLMRGPSLPDRVISLDLMGNFAVALICVFAVVFDTPALLSVGVVMALVLFLGTVAFAVYLDRRVRGIWSERR